MRECHGSDFDAEEVAGTLFHGATSPSIMPQFAGFLEAFDNVNPFRRIRPRKTAQAKLAACLPLHQQEKLLINHLQHFRHLKLISAFGNNTNFDPNVSGTPPKKTEGKSRREPKWPRGAATVKFIGQSSLGHGSASARFARICLGPSTLACGLLPHQRHRFSIDTPT